MDRRHFLQISGLLSASTLIPGSWAQAQSYNLGSLSILQGPTNETTTQIAVDIPQRNTKVNYQVSDLQTQRVLEVQVTGSYAKTFSGQRVDHLKIENLKLGHSYLLKVIDVNNRLLDEREFASLDTQKASGRVALLSCMYDLLGTNIQQIWKKVEESKPDALFLLGDNVYGDIGGVVFGPQLLWQRYIDTRRNLPLYHWRKLIPAFAIWDDHDFGKNNVGGSYTHAKDSLETFRFFYAQNEIPQFFSRGPGVSSSFELFGQKFLLLDGRSFRLLRSSKGVGFFGDDQLAWAFNEMSSTLKPLFLASGSQFFGGNSPKGETSEVQAPAEFRYFNAELAKLNRSIIFASGDVHFSEVMKIERGSFGFDAFELTSSSLHSLTGTSLPGNSRRVAGATGNNFTFVDFNQGVAEAATSVGINSVNYAHNIVF